MCSLKGEVLGWSIFFVGITATAFGSAYYHLKPNDARLVWDRLPVSETCLLYPSRFFIGGGLSLFCILVLVLIAGC
jgi:hypothetical protein